MSREALENGKWPSLSFVPVAVAPECIILETWLFTIGMLPLVFGALGATRTSGVARTTGDTKDSGSR